MSDEYKGELIRTNFIYPVITPQHYRFGSDQIQAIPLRPDGDWRDYLPNPEDQERNGIESAACYVEAQQHAIATLEEEYLAEANNNYAARFNALLSDGTENGGDPLRAADSFRHDGLVPDAMMPFADYIQSWADFHSWKGVNEQDVRAIAKKYLDRRELNYDVVYSYSDSVQDRIAKLKEALKYSPCPISVTAWFEQDGKYWKPDGYRDNHLVLAVYVDDQNQIYIWDTYAPYLKILAPNYPSEFGMRWSVKQKTAPTPEQIDDVKKKLLDLLMRVAKYLQSIINAKDAPNTPRSPTIEQPKPPPVTPPTYDFSTRHAAIKSVRTICDEEGLSFTHSWSVDGTLYLPKDVLCACIQRESNFDNSVVGLNRDKTGKIWSRDYGIVQINDYWNIGRNKPFASIADVVDNPDKAVRFMVKMMKAGKLALWSSYSSGAYKQHLPFKVD